MLQLASNVLLWNGRGRHSQPILHATASELRRLCKQRTKIGQTSWDCQEELFRQEVENADDVRLSYRLIRNCQADKQKFCKDVKPGMPRLGSRPAAAAGWPSIDPGLAAPHSIVPASS